jgi:hypothetical protein
MFHPPLEPSHRRVQLRHAPAQRPEFLSEFLGGALGERLRLLEARQALGGVVWVSQSHDRTGPGTLPAMNPAGSRWLSAALLIVARAALAQDGLAVQSPDLSVTPSAQERAAAPKRFGEARSRWWTLGAAVADDFHQTNDYNIQGAYSYFLIDDVEFVLEAAAWYFDQPGDTAYGFGPTMAFRWHFHNQDPWSVFADIGIGVLFTTDQVPDGGTSFDFTPRAGFGFTRRLNDEGTRLIGGIRWHHISNARIHGDDNNPGRDGIMLYAGVEWPF